MQEWRLAVPDDLRKSVKRYIERMIHYDVLIEFSWSGKTSIDDDGGKKLPFEELTHIICLIMDLIGGCPHVEIEAEIKYFMKRVPQSYKALQKKV